MTTEEQRRWSDSCGPGAAVVGLETLIGAFSTGDDVLEESQRWESVADTMEALLGRAGADDISSAIDTQLAIADEESRERSAEVDELDELLGSFGDAGGRPADRLAEVERLEQQLNQLDKDADSLVDDLGGLPLADSAGSASPAPKDEVPSEADARASAYVGVRRLWPNTSLAQAELTPEAGQYALSLYACARGGQRIIQGLREFIYVRPSSWSEVATILGDWWQSTLDDPEPMGLAMRSALATQRRLFEDGVRTGYQSLALDERTCARFASIGW